MTVSVADRAGVPWAVPVFYVNDRFRLYWVSRGSGRIISYLTENPRAVVTVLATDDRSTRLRGLQAEGVVEPVKGRLEWLKIMRRCATTFPDVMAQLAVSSGGRGILGKFRGLSIHRFEPERCWFTDHSRGFGHRVELDLARCPVTGT
jgi:uncharacterized protein YhbP (UPF0306 family)